MPGNNMLGERFHHVLHIEVFFRANDRTKKLVFFVSVHPQCPSRVKVSGYFNLLCEGPRAISLMGYWIPDGKVQKSKKSAGAGMGMGAGTSTGTIAGPGTSTGMVTGKVWDVVLALPAGREEEKGPSKKKTKFEAGSSRGNKEGTGVGKTQDTSEGNKLEGIGVGDNKDPS
ncbi:hypothetical protein V6N13_125869 [Hibiscus sabdariffa]